MKVVLGKFACFCVETRFGADISSGVQSAFRHYSRRLRSSTPPVAIPGFRRGRALERPLTELEVAVEPEIEDRLEREARDNAVDLQQIFNHAVFVYLADLDRERPGLGPAEEAPSPVR